MGKGKSTGIKLVLAWLAIIATVVLLYVALKLWNPN
jgi:hypothetical protein